MKTITYYIVIHNLESKKKFLELNKYSSILDKFVFLLAGDCKDNFMPYIFDNTQYELRLLDSNIEHYPTLLTFTAWLAVAKNKHLCKTDYVGIFEYDTEINFGNFFSQGKGNSYLKKNTIIGFNPRKIVGDPMFLDPVPGLVELLPDRWVARMMKEKGWNATTNVIMPVKFLKSFVDWYWGLVPEIMKYPNHPHMHERVVTMFAVNNKYKHYYFPDAIKHHQLNSHKIGIGK
jgi:hypothetical protein